MTTAAKKRMLKGLAFVGALALTGIITFFAAHREQVSISIGDDSESQQSENKVANEVTIEDQVQKQSDEESLPIQKKEFTQFGDFWIEVHTEKLDLKAPIVNGISKDDLKRGVGRHLGSALPNPDKGNVVISGHRWIPGRNPAYSAFRHVDKLEIGDKVSLFQGGKEYVYKVRESKTVSADAVEILEQTETPQLTLYTCTPLFTALKRLVYIADFVEVKNT